MAFSSWPAGGKGRTKSACKRSGADERGEHKTWAGGRRESGHPFAVCLGPNKVVRSQVGDGRSVGGPLEVCWRSCGRRPLAAACRDFTRVGGTASEGRGEQRFLLPHHHSPLPETFIISCCLDGEICAV